MSGSGLPRTIEEQFEELDNLDARYRDPAAKIVNKLLAGEYGNRLNYIYKKLLLFHVFLFKKKNAIKKF